MISAASVHDLRNQAHGGFTLKSERVALTAGYVYSTENDYQSNAFNVAARTDLFQHDTQLEIAYARNFDQVCDRVQAATEPAPRWVALEDHSGCFTSNPLRVTLPIDIDGYQGSWTQAWTPVFTTQLVYTGQILNGFQSNPYRSVILADGIKAQEHIPGNRGREAVALRGNYFLRPIKALRFASAYAAYWDTWNIMAGDVELEYFEKYLGGVVPREPCAAASTRRPAPSSGATITPAETLPAGPKGQYWTGDRELRRRSPASWGPSRDLPMTVSAGARAVARDHFRPSLRTDGRRDPVGLLRFHARRAAAGQHQMPGSSA